MPKIQVFGTPRGSIAHGEWRQDLVNENRQFVRGVVWGPVQDVSGVERPDLRPFAPARAQELVVGLAPMTPPLGELWRF